MIPSRFLRPLARVAALAALGMTLGASSCDFDGPPPYDLDVRLTEGMSVFAFERGDEATYVATERDIDATEQPSDSRIAPQNYGWSSSDTAVATISGGVLHARAIGATIISVQSLHVKKSFHVFVGPAFGRIELAPDSANIAIGETARFQIRAFSPAGDPISPDSSRGYVQLTMSTPGVALELVPVGYDKWDVVGTKTGTAKLVARVDVYRGSRLRDTAVLVVR
jgi:hypothetical protein